MEIFLDTADTGEIARWARTGLVDGVTTNPSLVKQAGRDFLEVLRETCALVPGHVSAEVVALDEESMLAEAEVLRAVASNVCIKLPLTPDGLAACRRLAAEGAAVNVTLCFSAPQALLAAKAGATYVSPFVGRHDDAGFDGMALIADIRTIFDNYDFRTKILVASVRHPVHVLESARLGADVVTLPARVLEQLFRHPLTDRGLEAFLEDWRATGQTIGGQTIAPPAS